MKKITKILLGFALFLGMNEVLGQVSITTLSTPFTQNFNTNAATVPTGWAFFEQLTNADVSFSSGTGTSGTGDTYFFGGPNEWSFGGLRSGNLNPTIGVSFTNNTGVTITSLQVSYKGETWRVGNANRSDRLDFQYSTNATSLSTGTWTNVDPLDYANPGQATGNGSEQHSSNINHTFTVNIPNGSTFWFRWLDFDATGSDDGMSVDDFSITAFSAGPEIQLERPVGTPEDCGFNYNFGSVMVSTNSDVIVRIANTGGANLTINSFSGLTAPFALVSPPTTPFNIPASGHQDITIRFSPTTTGSFSSTLTINNNDTDEGSCTINFSGTGTPFVAAPELQLQANPVTTNRACGYTLSYGTLQIAQTTDQIIRVRNVGTANLNITSATLGGPNASEFSIINPPASIVEPNEYTDIRVRHTPASTGTKNATITITNNDSDENSCVVNLTSTVNSGTYLEPGDVAILAFSAARATPSGVDEIILVFFKDITDQTVIHVTDNAYMKCSVSNPLTATNPVTGPLNPSSGGFGVTEGWIQLNYNSATPFPKGRTLTVRMSPGSPPTITIVAPASSGWTGSVPVATGNGFNLNPFGEQIFVLQGGTPNNNGFTAACSQGGTYSGTNARFLYGFNTKGNYWVPSCQNACGNSPTMGCGTAGPNGCLPPDDPAFQNFVHSGTQNSAKPANFDCFLVWPTSQADFSAYTGPLTPASQREWINRISNPTNWTGYSQTGYETYADATFTNHTSTNSGRLLVIDPGGYSAGVWIGDVNSDWFECRNWQNRRVPDQFTDVEINNEAVGDCEINSTSTLAPIAPTPNVADCKNFTIRTSASASRRLQFPNTGTHTLRIYGDWFNEKTTTNFQEGVGTVEFRSNTDQFIVTNDAINGESFRNLVLEKGTGSNLVLNGGNVTVQDITFNSNSLVVLGDNNFTVNGNIAGFNTNRFFQTKNLPASGGSLIQNVSTTAKVFPVGTANYTPATMQFASGNTDVRVRVFDGVFEHGVHGGSVASIAEWVNKTWEITPTNPLNSTITLQWNASDENASFNRTNSNILKNRSTLVPLTNLTWETANGSGTYNAASGSNPYTQTRSGITTYSKFGVSSFTVLPLELLSFRGFVNNKNEAQLLWQTASELNIAGFEIEKSTDGKVFNKIGFVSAKNANLNSYNFIDKDFAGLSYYRLRVLEQDNTFRYSQVISLDKTKAVQLVVYPNPATEKDFVKVAIGAREEITRVRIQVFSQTGKILTEFASNLESTENHLSEVLQALPKGLYILRLQTETGEMISTKFVKQ